ncbi:hypothetical protein NDU88_002556 [Pleurodeles waltl]|uniref:Uncharacterized protein n=1 Tax=Pleurodeles waltl TaxID=8319 RepID=A0AAV7UCQ1_PLEWA|nr:hypothetical protein NDU88_002556 [Pleurodeles waltl]
MQNPEATYYEEESTYLMPLDVEFCEAGDVSIQHTVSLALAPLEEKNEWLTQARKQGPSMAPVQSVTLRQASKLPMEQGIDMNAFEHLKKAFLQSQPQFPKPNPLVLTPHPSSPVVNDFLGDSDGDPGHSRLRRPSTDYSVSPCAGQGPQDSPVEDSLDPYD